MKAVEYYRQYQGATDKVAELTKILEAFIEEMSTLAKNRGFNPEKIAKKNEQNALIKLDPTCFSLWLAIFEEFEAKWFKFRDLILLDNAKPDATMIMCVPPNLFSNRFAKFNGQLHRRIFIHKINKGKNEPNARTTGNVTKPTPKVNERKVKA